MAENQDAKTRVAGVMVDPSAAAVARVYADAFLGAAASVGVEGVLEEFASFLDDVLGRNPAFESILLSGLLGRDDRIALIKRVVAPFGSKLFTNFLLVLAKHERLELLPLILSESRLKYETLSGRRRVQVTSAVELSIPMQREIHARLNAQFSFEPILETRTDPSLIGGLVIQIGDTVYDSSIRAQMKQLRARFKQRSLHEIQSGRDRFSHPEGD